MPAAGRDVVSYPLEGVGVGMALRGLSEGTRERLRALAEVQAAGDAPDN